MAGDIQQYEQPDQEVVASNSGGLLAQVVDAARNPAIDADKMKAMADLAIQLQDREMQQQFNRDLNAAIMEMPVITKGGRIVIKDKNTGQVIQSTAFAKFEDLDRVVKPIARRNNIGYNFDTGGDANRLLCRIILRHTNGYVQESSAMPLPLETSGSKNNVQGAGSSNSYGKRYVLQNAFAISTEGEDDDGNLGMTIAMPHEREATVMDEARAAHAEGRYEEWYRGQSPKDRAYLVTSGHHTGFGGGAALPKPEPDVREKVDPDPAQKKESDAGVQRLGWVQNYTAKVTRCGSLDDLIELQESQKLKLAQIRDGYPDLQQVILRAHTEAYDRFGDSGSKDGPDEAEDLFDGGEG